MRKFCAGMLLLLLLASFTSKKDEIILFDRDTWVKNHQVPKTADYESIRKLFPEYLNQEKYYIFKKNIAGHEVIFKQTEYNCYIVIDGVYNKEIDQLNEIYYNFSYMTTGDIDGDGVDEILYVSDGEEGDNGFDVYKVEAKRLVKTYSLPVWFYGGEEESPILRLEDINKDGIKDIIVYSDIFYFSEKWNDIKAGSYRSKTGKLIFVSKAKKVGNDLYNKKDLVFLGKGFVVDF